MTLRIIEGCDGRKETAVTHLQRVRDTADPVPEWVARQVIAVDGGLGLT